jgi:HD-GYP domain-containing protein (c-di-GMP phosphodiesterase class II)
MPSREQIWVSPHCSKQRLAQWLRRRYTICKALPSQSIEGKAALQAKPKNPKKYSEQRRLPASDKPHIVCIADPVRDDLSALRKLTRDNSEVRLIGMVDARPPSGTRGIDWFAWVPHDAAPGVVEKTVRAAFASIESTVKQQATIENLARTEREMQQLHQIGIALSSTRDSHSVLELILTKAREMTHADAGSIYLVEEKAQEDEPNGDTERTLRFKLSQNESVQFPKSELVMQMSEKSIAGHVALHGEALNLADAYRIPAKAPYRFNSQLDIQLGYHTKSMLTLPMKNAKGTVLGVLQLINCKRDRRVKLASPEIVAREVQPFGPRAMQFALSLASQAAVSYENSKLYQDIEKLFEGFVQAAVTAIEQRDPTTSGHSQRVSDMTCGLAEAVDRTGTGEYADIRFSLEQMKEIRYAALLHDFGKVAVREEVLVKAKKLYPGQFSVVQTRFDYVRKDLEAHYEKKKLDVVILHGADRAREQVIQLESELRKKLAELDDAFQFIMNANEPTVLPEGKFDRLIEIGRQSFLDPRGVERNLLTPEEIRFLSIPKGSLDASEREQIESHVVHSFNFLMQIPWTQEIRGIPAIARAHHEKLNGTGYPYKLKSEEIPIQAKIMTVCDIFDALSAADRPYKKAVSPERALAILDMSVKDKELDPVLFNLFVDAKIYQRLRKSD